MAKSANKKLEKIANKELYRMVKDGAVIDVGGLDDGTTFYPEASSSKWDGECWLKLSHKDKEKIPKNKKAKEKTKDGKLEVEIDVEGTGRKHRMREGSLEWDIEYTDVSDLPVDNIERFDLDFPDSLSWYEQKELTQEEKDFGYVRPDNVINSFVGYFDKKNNEYETGKFCHLYRSKLIANDGAETWVVQGIVNNELQISIDRDWCNIHGFPVILDPLLGYDTVGGSFFDGFEDYLHSCGFNAVEDGNITSMSWYCQDIGSIDVVMGVYSDNSGEPDTLLIQGDELVTSDQGWISTDMELSITDGVMYHLTKNYNSTSTKKWYYDTVGFTAHYRYRGLAYNATMPASYGTPVGTSTDRAWSVYVTYTAGGSFPGLNVSAVVRTSNTVVTITL